MVTLLLGERHGPDRICPSPAAEGLSRWTPPAAVPFRVTAATLAEPPRAAEQGSPPPITTETTSHKTTSGSWTPTVMKTTVTVDRHLPLPSLCPQSVMLWSLVTCSILVFVHVVHTCYTILHCVLWDHSFNIFNCLSKELWGKKYDELTKKDCLNTLQFAF